MTDASALWTNDTSARRAQVNMMDVLKTGTSAAKVHPFKMVSDFMQIARGPGKLTFDEYINYRLYDRELYPDNDARMRFLSERRHWPLCNQCSDPDWKGATEDKWIAELMLREASIRTTNTLAIVGGGIRNYGRTPLILDPNRFAEFMAARTEPTFAKVNGGLGSEGATRILPLGDGRYNVAGIGETSAVGLFNVLRSAPGAYLLQDELVHHPEVSALIGDRIATIRAISFVVAGKVHTPLTVLKLPVGSNIADNFWRNGNLVADLDEKTGTIRRVVRGMGPEQEEITHHPDTSKALIGQTLPMWSDILDVIKETGRLYAPVGFQSMDITITKDGPTVVEVNTGSSFVLSQVARGEGFLSNEVLELFMRAGAQIDTKKLKLD